MKEVDALLCSNENFRFVTVAFQVANTPSGWSKPYTYKTLLDLKEDDLVVVSACKGEESRMKVAKVTEILPPFSVDIDSEASHKWVMSIVDLSVYEDCLAAERQMIAQLSMAKAKKLQQEALTLIEDNVGSSVIGKLKAMVKKL